ncbi:MAG: hypothetical protein K0M55_02785 [Rhizobium sp.]|nr:hypothetical protein [Rhizobium sp.]MBW8321147.1 hypothetical protein [Rhizobium sp.]MBW8447901.1 hypothetical protein [Arenimonas sp.]
MDPKLIIISLGAGVQSTTMALMAAHGEIGPMPDCAIFADTGDEPEAVYDHLKWLMSPNVLPFPVIVVSEGKLSAELLSGNDMARVPFFVGKGGLSARQCTRNFKIRPVRRQIRKCLGVAPRGYVAPGSVSQWIGISTDEVMRVKPSGARFIENRHPLIEKRMTRGDCLQWLLRNGYPRPPKSACVYCPYQSNAQWREKDPVSMAQAIAVDEALRTPENVVRFRGELYVHPSLKPLRDVDFSNAEDRGQLNLFNNECEGMCGV